MPTKHVKYVKTPDRKSGRRCLFSVVVPTHDRPKVLARTLDGLERQECSFKFEVIVVDDASTLPLPELGFGEGKRRDWRLIRLEENLGRAATRNRGIAAARGEFVLMLDDDIWAEPQLLQAHFDKQREMGGGVVVGAVPPSPENADTVWNRYTNNRFDLVGQRLRAERLDYGLFLTGNVSVPASALRKTGGFDETFTEYSFEDSELGLRLEKLGLRFAHAERAVGWHRFEETGDSVCRKAYQLGRSSFLFARMHPERARDIQYHSLTLGPWRGIDAAKNLAKLAIFNRAAIGINKLSIDLLAAAGLERQAYYLITWLRQQNAAEGIRSKEREEGNSASRGADGPGTRCNLCGSGDCSALHDLYDEKAGLWTRDIRICGCRRCGHVFSHFRPGAEARYGGEYYIFSDHREKADLSFAGHCLAWLEKSVPIKGRRLLDVGCGRGHFCRLASGRGAVVTGLDPGSNDPGQSNRGSKYTHFRCELEDLSSDEGSFDVVTMWDVLEHLDRPPESLSRIHNLLKPGGHLALSVPNHESIFAKLAGRFWRGYNPYHVSHFSLSTLKALLVRNGFGIVRMETFDNSLLTGEGFYRTGWNERLKEALTVSAWRKRLLERYRSKKRVSIVTGHDDYMAGNGRGLLNGMLANVLSSWSMGDQIRVIAAKTPGTGK